MEDEFFYAKLIDVVNSSFNQGKKILDSRVVSKIPKSLLEEFKLR